MQGVAVLRFNEGHGSVMKLVIASHIACYHFIDRDVIDLGLGYLVMRKLGLSVFEDKLPEVTQRTFEGLDAGKLHDIQFSYPHIELYLRHVALQLGIQCIALVGVLALSANATALQTCSRFIVSKSKAIKDSA